MTKLDHFFGALETTIEDIVEGWDAYCICADEVIRASKERCPICELKAVWESMDD